MPRESFSSLILSAQNLVQSDESTSRNKLSDVKTFLTKELNNGVTEVYNALKDTYVTERQQTAATVADQQYYHLPPDFGDLHSVTHTVGGIAYQLQQVDSLQEWERMNIIISSGTVIPQFFFLRRDDFGIWPIPSASDDTLTLNYSYILRDLDTANYTSGTVATSQNSTTVTGTSTTFTAGMVDRWFKATDGGDWYRIATFSSTTELVLESVFESSAVSGSKFIIGQSPEIPVNMHHYLPHYAAMKFFMGPRREPSKAQEHSNIFWTGDLNNSSRVPSRARSGVLGNLAHYKSRGRGNSQLARRRGARGNRTSEVWRISLTS